MEEYQIKTKVVGVDISNERTTYAIVDIRGNINCFAAFKRFIALRAVQGDFVATQELNFLLHKGSPHVFLRGDFLFLNL